MTADAVVVGAGVMGSATAWQLARRGLDVVVLERFARGHDRGSSHGDARIFRLAYDDVSYIRLALEALGLWRELEAEAGADLLTVTGGVDHGRTPDVMRIAAAMDTCDVAHELLRPEEATERWPGMRFEEVVLHQPDAGSIHADRAVRALQDAAVAAGADVRFESPAIGIDGLRSEFRGATVVVTAGAWAAKLLDGVVPLPRLRITEEQPAHFAPRVDAPWPAFIHYGDFLAYGLPGPAGTVKVGEHGGGPEVDPDVRPGGVNRDRLARLGRYVEDWFPGLDPAPVATEHCMYTNTDEAHFVLDRVGAVVVGSPCSGHGFKFAPAIGRVLADLVTGDPAVDPRWRLTS